MSPPVKHAIFAAGAVASEISGVGAGRLNEDLKFGGLLDFVAERGPIVWFFVVAAG